MRSIAKKIATTVAGGIVLLGALAFNSSKVEAATINYDLTIDLFSGESFTGMFSFDDSNLTGVGEEALLPADNVKVTLPIFGEIITEEDDIDFEEGLFPAVNFSDGEFLGLDILAAANVGEPEFGGFLVVGNDFSFITTEYFDLLGPGSLPVEGFQEIAGTVSYELQTETTPESTSILSLLTLGAIGAGSIWKKKKSHQPSKV